VPADDPTTERTSASSTPRYEIRVHGHLGSRWVSWFDGLELTTEDDGTTVLRGPVVDQSALHGLLQKLRDLGIPLVSLAELPSAPRPEGPDAPNQPSHHNPSGATS
jgi:hypothetical protein